jgi:hypothetical protein
MLLSYTEFISLSKISLQFGKSKYLDLLSIVDNFLSPGFILKVEAR